MADPTEAQLKAAARKALAAGDQAAAKRLIDAARKAAASAPVASPGTMPVAAMSPVAQEGMAAMSGMTRNPSATPPDRTWGHSLYDNIVGDPTDGVDSYGESIGRGLNDIGSAAGAGLVRGVTSLAGLPGTLGDLGEEGFLKAGKMVGVFPEDWQSTGQSPLSGGAMTAGLSDLTDGATDFKGDSRIAKFAGTAAEFLPGAALFGGMNPSNLVKYGIIPGVTSEGAGQLTEGTAFEPYARLAGALAGGLLPDLLKKVGSKMVSPYGGADPERLNLAKFLEEQGVPLTAGQKVGNEALRRKEGFTAAGQELMETQAEAFTRAALKTTGTDASRATPEVLKATADRIGNVFDDVVRGVDVTPDAKAITALSESVSTYKSLAPTGSQAPLISEVFKETVKAARGNNTIPASTLKVWRSNLSKLTSSADAATRQAAIDALEAVDDMMATALTAAGKTDDIARLAEARGQWRNFLAVQRAATGAGENAAAGLVSPSALRNSVVQQGRSSYAQGTRGDIADLARAGEGVMKKLPTSGTAENLRALLPSAVPSALGATFGSMLGPWGTALGAGLGAVAPKLAGMARMSGPMQAYLANQILPKAATNFPKGATTSILPFLDDPRLAAQ